jgi:predicted CXXCH cytochrome family protein
MKAQPNKNLRNSLAAVVVLLLAGCAIALGGIVGSLHDLSDLNLGTNEICIFCHTPHNANAAQLAPLWNHKSTTASYTLYSSPTMNNAPAQPGNASKVCLSCHDGTVAIDSYGDRSGSQMITGGANLGTNLSDDHPISMSYHEYGEGRSPAAVPCSNCHGRNPSNLVSVLPFFGGLVECATCHDPHDKYPAYGKMLRKPIAGSALCLHCHAK